MNVFHTRNTEKEILDDLTCSGEAVSQNLKELDIINTLLGGNAISINAVKKILRQYPEIKKWKAADLGCGSGHLMVQMLKVFQESGKEVYWTGYDANPFISEYARQHCLEHPEIHILCSDILAENSFKENYHLVHASLFLHHFTEEQLIVLLRKLKQQTSIAVIINDLERNPLAYYSILWLTRLFSKSYLVKNDAALSVAKGFKKNEWEKIIKNAGFTRYNIRWAWAFRHRIILYPDSAR